jgi:shikimate dehydrogenase
VDRYAVIGNPVAHSLSPLIHRAFAAATGQVMRYETRLAPREAFAGSAEAFFAEGGAGLNVTVPFKAAAAEWVQELEPAARAAGAVNTIVRRGTGYGGYNTDGVGLVRDLEGRCGVELHGARVLLLGAGGAARGALAPLLDAGPARLVVANRTSSSAAALVGRFQTHRNASVLDLRPMDAPGEGFDVIVNATSAGMTGDVTPALPSSAACGAICYDMVYVIGDDGLTAFNRWALGAGAVRAVDGLGMLVEQAALAFELWRGVAPATAPVLALLERHRRLNR